MGAHETRRNALKGLEAGVSHQRSVGEHPQIFVGVLEMGIGCGHGFGGLVAVA
jgi:hypothetical protein